MQLDGIYVRDHIPVGDSRWLPEKIEKVFWTSKFECLEQLPRACQHHPSDPHCECQRWTCLWHVIAGTRVVASDLRQSTSFPTTMLMQNLFDQVLLSLANWNKPASIQSAEIDLSRNYWSRVHRRFFAIASNKLGWPTSLDVNFLAFSKQSILYLLLHFGIYLQQVPDMKETKLFKSRIITKCALCKVSVELPSLPSWLQCLLQSHSIPEFQQQKQS